MSEDARLAPGGIEYGALGALSLGALVGTFALPLTATRSVIGLILCAIGIGLLWRSRAWDTTDKILGTALLPIGFWVIELIHLLDRETDPGDFELSVHHGLEVFIVVTDIVVSLATLAWLIYRLKSRTSRR